MKKDIRLEEEWTVREKGNFALFRVLVFLSLNYDSLCFSLLLYLSSLFSSLTSFDLLLFSSILFCYLLFFSPFLFSVFTVFVAIVNNDLNRYSVMLSLLNSHFTVYFGGDMDNKHSYQYYLRACVMDKFPELNVVLLRRNSYCSFS